MGGTVVTVSRVRRFLSEEAQSTGLPVAALLLGAVALHVTVTLLAVNPWHPDEHFQILEFAWARAGHAPVADLPWEFAARIRPTLQPTLALGLLKALGAVGLTSPYAWTLALRLGTLALAFVVLLHVVSHLSPKMTRAGRQVLWLTSLFLWFAPLFTSRFTSENLGGLALAAALPLVEDERGRGRDAVIAVLLGLSFVARFQMAFAVAALLLWIAKYRGSWTRATRVGIGAAAVVGAGSMVDRWFYDAWVFTPWEYFRVNLIDGAAAGFGASPWYAYLQWTPLWMGPPLGLAIVALLLFGVASRRDSAWSWTLVAFVVGHSLIAHKELRFFFPLLYLLPVLIAFGWEELERKTPSAQWRRPLAWILVTQNAVMAALLVTPSVHRGKDFDWHYYRFLWDAAEAQEDENLFVLQEQGRPYLTEDLELHVYRHPKARAIDYMPGDSIDDLMPGEAPRGALLVMAGSGEVPAIGGVERYELAYEAEPGYRVMARWAGAEDSGFIKRLESVDRWTGSQRIRQVYRVLGP